MHAIPLLPCCSTQMLHEQSALCCLMLNKISVHLCRTGCCCRLDVDRWGTSMMVTTLHFWLSLSSVFTKSKSLSCNISFSSWMQSHFFTPECTLLIENLSVNLPLSLVLNWEISPQYYKFKFWHKRTPTKTHSLGHS